MSAVDLPRRRRSESGSADSTSSPSRSSSHLPAHLLGSPLVWTLACVAGAVLTWATLPTVPSYDPWSWIVWGREVSDPHLSFVVGGGPSWKPLPFLFTVVWGLFGGAAPTLWVITARVGGLLGLVAAWRLAHRLAGGGVAGGLAGALAVGGVLLTQDWFYYFYRGTSEVGLIACTLWAVDRLLDRHHAQAFWLAVAASLIRPEWWPVLCLDALWLWLRDPGGTDGRRRGALLVGLAAVALLWFGPPWIGSGDPLLAAQHAAHYDGHLGPDPLRAVIGRGVDLQVWPLLITGIVAVLVGAVRDRSRVCLGLGLAVVGWWAVVVGMTLEGYPGLERFFLPAASVICVLGGVGIVQIARAVGACCRVAPGGARVATGVALVALIAVSLLVSRARISQAAAAEPAAARAQTTIAGLDRAAAAVGGHAGVFPCAGPASFAAVNHGVQTALAWTLHVTLERVGTAMSNEGVDFIGPRTAATGEAAPVDPRLTQARTLATVDGWRVVRLTDPHNPHSTACVGR